MAKNVKISDLVLRDAHQSLHATRMTTADMLPICSKLDSVGYFSLEGWGGATFDSCIRFLNEDPWERLRKLHAALPNTPIMMLLRGQNLLGYRHYADDVVDKFVEAAARNGIGIFRIFDACNDPRNLKRATDAAKKTGKHVQMAISYATTPYHTKEIYADLAKSYADFGADSICIKDMSGLLTPYAAYDLVKAIKASVSIPVQLHTHYTTGLASMTLLKAIEAGVDIVDTAISPMAMGTSQPPTEAIVATLAGTGYDTGLKMEDLNKINSYFTPIREKYIASGLLDPKVLKVDVNGLTYQVPGGMLSNLVSQLKQQGKSDKLEEVLAEVPRVREDAGYPPLVTPTSQIVGTQAVLNVISGERYKLVSKEFKGMIRGEYGRCPVEVSDEFRKKIIGSEEPITCRPADVLKPELDILSEEIRPYLEQEEDVLSYALFGPVATKFFEYRKAKRYGVDAENSDPEKKVHSI